MGNITWTWEEYFLKIADAVGVKSKDNSEVGAVLTTPDHLIIATGFNGVPRFVDSEFEKRLVANDKAGDEEAKRAKLGWMVHGEANAVFNAARMGVRTEGTTLYVNKFPCYGCMQTIIQAGIARVYTEALGYWENDELDLDHEKVRYLVEVAKQKLKVVAPNIHDLYRQPNPPEKPPTMPPPRRSDPPPQSRSRH